MVKRLIICAACIVAVAHGQYSRPGSSTAQFLKIGVSPRGAGMAGAYIAAAQGAEATYYNSAALAWIQGTDLVFNHTSWFAGISHEFGAAAHSFGDVGTFGISIIALSTDLMPVRTPLQPDGTGETFSAGSYRGSLSYARFLTDRVTIGVTGSYIYESLYADFNSNSIAIDIAAMYTSDWRAFRFAMQIANFGADETFVNESYPLPTNFTFGLCMNAIDGEVHKVLVSFSATKPNDGKPLGSIGAEWNFGDLFFARAGYQLYHDVATYSFGAGVQGALFGPTLHADYSFSSYKLLGGVHRFGAGVSF